MLFQSVLAHPLAQDGPDDGREPVMAHTGAGLARIRMHFMVPPVVDETTELAPGTAFLFVNVDDVALARPRVFPSVGHEQNGRGGVRNIERLCHPLRGGQKAWFWSGTGPIAVAADRRRSG